MFFPVIGIPTSLFCTTGFGPRVERSSRYRVMSSEPTGTGVFSMRWIIAPSRWARKTPRRRIPTKPRSAAPSFFSIISWASRTRVRSISEADMSCAFSRRLDCRDEVLGVMNAASYAGRAMASKKVCHHGRLKCSRISKLEGSAIDQRGSLRRSNAAPTTPPKPEKNTKATNVKIKPRIIATTRPCGVLRNSTACAACGSELRDAACCTASSIFWRSPAPGLGTNQSKWRLQLRCAEFPVRRVPQCWAGRSRSSLRESGEHCNAGKMPCLPQPTRVIDVMGIPPDFKLPQSNQERQGTRDRNAEVRSQKRRSKTKAGAPFSAPETTPARSCFPFWLLYSDFYFRIPTSYFCIRSDRVLATTRLHIDQREIRAFAVIRGLDRNNVLILLGPNLQLDDFAAVISLALQFLRIVATTGMHIDITTIVGGVALEHVAILFHLIVIIGNELCRRILRDVFNRNDLQPESAAGNIDVGALLFSVLLLFLETRSGINRQSGVSRVGIIVDVNSADGSLDIDFLVLSILAVLNIYTATDKREQRQQAGC